MRIAVINETSAADRNRDITAALEGRGHELVNAGMKKSGEPPELTYINTGFMSALLLNAGRADLVVGGCGTGQGYLNAVMQYPGVVCGHILTPLDAWLFPQINGGNCIALMLNQAYGWGSDVNLKLLFDALFSAEQGAGYPPSRKESQCQSRARLADLSKLSHRPMAEIIGRIEEQIIRPALDYPGFWELLDVETLADRELAQTLKQRRR
ncbi:MAG: ribose-5-phosphate isomerase [Myxococcales bacterium]|nr:MAG: ribose-5-phosphate isomerase [Myxococcales bacterium]